jgi:(2Fe-2S) ferredoxin
VQRFEHHIFVCQNVRDESDARGCCMARGGGPVLEWFKAEVHGRGWKSRMRVNKAGCLDACDFGPTVVVYPEGTWYSPRTQEDVRAICDRHLARGELVKELLIPAFHRE